MSVLKNWKPNFIPKEKSSYESKIVWKIKESEYCTGKCSFGSTSVGFMEGK